MSPDTRFVVAPVSPETPPSRKALSGPHVTAGEEGGQTTERAGHWRSYGVGIDCHSRFITVTVVIPNYATGRETHHQKNFDASFADLKRAKKWVQATLPVRPEGAAADFHYTLESSATYHLPVVCAFGGTPSVINPNLAKLGARKTDRIDSRSLAQQDLQGKWPASYQHTPEQTALRVLIKERRRWANIASALSKSISTGLNKFGYTFQVLGSPRDSAVRPVIEDFLRGKEPLEAEAKACLSGVPIPAALTKRWLECFDQIDAVQKKVNELEREVRTGLRTLTFWTDGGAKTGKEMLTLLDTIPGVGDITAMTWLLEVGEIRRFVGCKAAVAWAGFDPSLKVSAGKVTAHVRRKGNRLIHYLVCEGAGSVLRRNSHWLGAWGLRLARKHRKGGWQKAVGAVGRRMVQGLYWVTYRGEPWQPHVPAEVTDDAAEVEGVDAGSAGRRDREDQQRGEPGRRRGRGGERTHEQPRQSAPGATAAVPAERPGTDRPGASDPAHPPGGRGRQRGGDVHPGPAVCDGGAVEPKG
jgi:transposase